ncbi:Probable RNA-directed DNA polymerase from transposon BS [Eumeta japonica]|uniref:Probable RNA-directed DNA polymerase from transposon BS n=1 Tax=Eumeta variegata TaxID=151549 RepID=A0A4C1YU48_EUMVA|nr:Probable RNA-directed DNA polymerase from transposon BS [Eumeta japonica]
MMSVYPLTTSLDLRLAWEFSSLDPRNGAAITIGPSGSYPRREENSIRSSCMLHSTHIRTVIEDSSWTVPANSDRKELPRDVRELIKAKTLLCVERANTLHVTIAKALKTEKAVPTPALKKLDNSIAFDDRRAEEELRRKVSFPPKDDLHPIVQDEVTKHIKALKIRKAPRVDSISTWKEAVVVGIPTPGKPRYLLARHISLLSMLGKLFKKTLKTRLSEHLIGESLIIHEQFGFRPNHSCPQKALRLVEYVSEGFKDKRKAMAVFFDLAKAFDRAYLCVDLGNIARRKWLRHAPVPDLISGQRMAPDGNWTTTLNKQERRGTGGYWMFCVLQKHTHIYNQRLLQYSIMNNFLCLLVQRLANNNPYHKSLPTARAATS